MQRIDGHAQTPLQLARVDDRVDPNYDEDTRSLLLQLVEDVSKVSCYSSSLMSMLRVFCSLPRSCILVACLIPKQLPTSQAPTSQHTRLVCASGECPEIREIEWLGLVRASCCLLWRGPVATHVLLFMVSCVSAREM